VQGFGSPATQSVYATFTAQVLSVNASVGTGGSVTPRSIGNIYYGQKLIAPLKFVFTPNTGFSVQSIIGVPAGATVSPPLPAAVNVPVTVTFPTGFTFTGNVNLAGTFFGPPVANAGAPQTVFPGTMVTLDGGGSTGTITSYAWVQTGGPASVSLTQPVNTSNATFTAPAVEGSYTFKLTVQPGGATAASTVNVTTDPAAAVRNQCQNCHQANGVGIAANVYGNWSSSRHRANFVMCYSCHVDANTGGHPGPAVTDNVCKNCHLDQSGNVPNHLVQIGTIACIGCHDPHTTAASRISNSLPPPHVNTVTTGTYPASYVTPRSSCRDCHSTADTNAAIRNDWASSGHGDTGALPWIDDDFKTRDDCVRCHTTTGYVNYVTSGFTNTAAWGDPADKTKEVLACNGCHNPDFSRRAFNLAGPTGPSFTFTFPVSGTNVTTSYQFSSIYNPPRITNTDSNVCMPCHIGTVNGEIIKKATAFADFTGMGRLQPHGMAATGMLGELTGAGYNYDETYHVAFGTSDQGRHWSYHEYIGSTNFVGEGTKGACVTCHTSGTQHTFAAVFKNSTGSITGLTTQAVCDKCHGSNGFWRNYPVSAAVLNASKKGFASALLVLKAQLQKSGFDPDSSDPKNWGGTSHVRANNMGAYYNYFLLRDGDRAAYVHGPAYSRRLIVASLNWLDDGTFNTSSYATILSLASEGRITAATRDSAISYLGITSTPGILSGMCGYCHGGVDGNIY
jgi:predicted CXXCH cytochrome family protein